MTQATTLPEGQGDWIEWSGGECPVAQGERFHVRYRDGLESVQANVADEMWATRSVWKQTGDQRLDIIAYRIARS